ncbi:TerC/Alx family metal homeostasis membrane protein [Flavobacterium sp. ASW18X]|uniref:TerC/Alx family metal homeostasis membrane protein n=1 Tax=Flavobacterium sp. ASW18X TaxID=2572595 RepID=UPI0010AE3701|nr:TerC/Alx family metal homeostasis membrane protein [Flavobacterium sp. ASW18X]TKD67301.1 TerC/Alx family metal homeostasis membrane protein [Flavobacterium sp. ASW18X]
MESNLPWIILIGHVLLLLFIDFFVLHKKNEVVTNKKALWETVFFVTNALLFTGAVYYFYTNGMVANPTEIPATEAVFKYISGYLIELSLSVDNLFVIAIIFTGYNIPLKYQHKLLFLGILGAIIFRALLIGFGLLLIHKFHNITIIFGLFLLYTAITMFKKNDKEDEPSQKNKGIAKFFNISDQLDGDKFRTTINGKKVFTALFGALITIEFTDLLFALDSIPAILAITTDPYLIFSSNIFAIMGLRSLYFFLANMLERFHYLKYSVFAILIFVAFKLMLANWIKIPEWISLTVIAIALGIGIWVSMVRSKK